MLKRLARIPLLWLLIFLLASLLLTAGGRLAPLDEETTFQMTANFVERGQLTIDQRTFTPTLQTYPGFLPRTEAWSVPTTWAVSGQDGQLYPQFAPGQSLAGLPLYLIGRLVGGGAPSMVVLFITRFTTSLFNPIVIALTAWLIALFATRLGFSTRLSVLLAMAYAPGSMALPYTHTYFGEPLIALTITLVAYALYRVKSDRVHVGRWPLISGIALAVAIFTRERSAIMFPAFLVYAVPIIQRDWRRWLIWLLPLVIAGALIGLMNWSRYGSPLTFGFSVLQHTSFTTPLLLGLYGLLISPGKGLLLYNPIAWAGLIGLISLWRRWRAEAILFALNIVAEIGFFAIYEFWTGGWNWGPRYILPIVPLLILAAGAWVHANPTSLRRAIVIGLVLIGFGLNLPAVLVDHSRYLVEFGERDPGHYLERSVLHLEDSPLTQQWPTVFEVASMYARPETWTAAKSAIDTHLQNDGGGPDLESLSIHLLGVDEFMRLNTPDFWFVHLWLLGVSPIWIGLSVLLLLALIFVSGRKVFQRLRAEG